MMKIKKALRFNIALIVMLVGVFLSLNLVFASPDLKETLRVPITQDYGRIKEAMTEYGKINILLIEREEYPFYADIFRKISKEDEKEMQKQKAPVPGAKETRPTSSTWQYFRLMGYVLDSPSESRNILALFVVKDTEGKVIGAELLYKPEYTREGFEEIRLKGPAFRASSGNVVVRRKYQGRGVGTALRKTAFQWLQKERYNACVSTILEGNDASRRSLEKVCRELGLVVEPIERRVPGGRLAVVHYIVHFDRIAVSLDGKFLARARLGARRGYEERGMHLRPANALIFTIGYYIDIIQRSNAFDPETSVKVLCNRIDRKSGEESDAIPGSLDLPTLLALSKGDEVDIIVSPVGELPEFISRFIMKKIIAMIEDEGNYLESHGDEEKLRDMIRGFKEGQIGTRLPSNVTRTGL